MSEERDARLGRRRLLRAGAGAVGVGLVGTGATGTAVAQSGPFGGWMSDVGNYEGVVDATGQEEATVEVGVEANGGAYGFGPAAIHIDPGTTVRWEWTGEGQQHNVVDEAGNFESDLTSEEGFTYERTFDAAGVVKYFCRPHRGLGMKGVVVVGDLPDAGGGDGGGSGGDSGTANSANQTALRTMVAMLVLGILSPLLFLLLLRWRQEDDSDQPKRYPR